MKLNEIDENLFQKFIQAMNLGMSLDNIRKNPRQAAHDAVTGKLDSIRNQPNPYRKGDEGFMQQYKKKKKKEKIK